VRLTIVVLITTGIIIGFVSRQVRAKRHRSLPEVSDARFGDYCREHLAIDPADGIAERRYIAKVIGISAEKLSPEMDFRQLLAGPLDSATRVSLGHLEDDLMDLAKQAGVVPQPLPATVLELVRLGLDLKTRRSQRSK
jgi:hypothetical protein